jgi:DNA-binding Lrp family transcriptional regulator
VPVQQVEETAQFLTVKQVAVRLGTSEDTVVRRFENRKDKGVIDIGAKETRYTRGRRQLRITEEAYQRYLIDARACKE